MMPRPSGPDSVSFYKAALAAAMQLDSSASDHRLLDSEADTAWRAYGDDLPVVIRVDLVLKNLAILYPAAFAPGPVFDLPGWYDDDPWGVGFERPPKEEVEALWRNRKAPASFEAALDAVAAAWTIVPTKDAAFNNELSPTTNIIVAGAGAMLRVGAAFYDRDDLDVRTQVLLVADQPAPRQVFGVACAFGRQAGIPKMLKSAPKEAIAKADELGLASAALLVVSKDATDDERNTAFALADHLRVSERVELEAP